MHLNLDIKPLIRKNALMLCGSERQIEVFKGQGRNLDGTHNANLQMIEHVLLRQTGSIDLQGPKSHHNLRGWVSTVVKPFHLVRSPKRD